MRRSSKILTSEKPASVMPTTSAKNSCKGALEDVSDRICMSHVAHGKSDQSAASPRSVVNSKSYKNCNISARQRNGHATELRFLALKCTSP